MKSVLVPLLVARALTGLLVAASPLAPAHLASQQSALTNMLEAAVALAPAHLASQQSALTNMLEAAPAERIMQDALLSVPRLIAKYGYPVETHKVTTEDGYILEMFRIPYGKKSPPGPLKPVVFLQHGLFSSSVDWVMMGTEKGFGYILADLGYDVWLGNSRGNTYSRAHTTLDPDVVDGPFWNFSWHEMGLYDIPAAIDYILAEVGQEKLFYVGHSQGTTQFYVMASERPEYNAKIRAMISLAPIAFMHNAPSPLLQVIANMNDTSELEALFGVRELLKHSNVYTLLGDQFCRDNAVTQVICVNFIFLIAGFNPDQFNATMMPVIMGHAPAGASSKQLVHYGQEVQSGYFRQFDYRQANMDVYGSESPPDYDLSKITCPVTLHYSSNDWLAATVDVETLHHELPNSSLHLVPMPSFNHIDYIWALDVKSLLYDHVVKQMSKY